MADEESGHYADSYSNEGNFQQTLQSGDKIEAA